MNDLALIHLGIAAEAAEMSMETMAGFVAAKAVQYSNSELYTTKEMPAETIQGFKELNKVGQQLEKPWYWLGDTQTMGKVTESEQYGYKKPGPMVAAVFDAVPRVRCFKVNFEKNVTPVLQQNDVIKFWAYSKYCYEAVARVDMP